MNRKHKPNTKYVLAVYLLGVMAILALYGPRPERPEPRPVITNEPPELAAYRDRVTHNMDLITRSGCFRRSDACYDLADEVITHSENGLTVERYRKYVAGKLKYMWKVKCLRKVGTCKWDVLHYFPEWTEVGK